MGIIGSIKDFGGDIVDGVKDGAKFVGDHADDVGDGALEALHTAAYGVQESVTAPINLNAHIVNNVTGRDLVPELELIGPSDTAKKIGDFVSPVTDVVKYADNLAGEFSQSALYAVQEPINGGTQLLNEVSGTSVPRLDIIAKPEEASSWSPQWLAQKAGFVTGTVAPFFLAGGGTLAIGSRLGARSFGLAGIEVTRESALGLRAASALTGTAELGFAYGFLGKSSDGRGNFWADRVNNGYNSTLSVGGESVLRQTADWIGDRFA